MTLDLPEKLKILAKMLPCPLYVVGGYVRNALLGFHKKEQDLDISAPIRLEEFVEVCRLADLKISAVYKNTGTAKIAIGDEEIEFSSFRHDKYVRGHRPSDVEFTTDIELDCRRRDFSCNAVYYDIDKGEIVDPLGGMKDIELKRLRTVVDGDKVFSEDGLRLLRLVRFYSELGFSVEEKSLEAAKRNVQLLSEISVERVYDELKKILVADRRYGNEFGQYKGLKLMHEIGAFKIIFPELALGEGIVQNSKFHKYDVLEHSLRTVLYADPSIRMAALLHDVGKPQCYLKNGNFYEHEVVGEKMVREILTRLKAPKREIDEVALLTLSHMYDYNGEAREVKVRRYILKYNSIFPKILLLKQADFSACRDDLEIAPTVDKFERIYDKMTKEHAPKSLKELNINGNDILSLGIYKAEIGKVLEDTLISAATGAIPNEKAALLEYVSRNFILKRKK